MKTKAMLVGRKPITIEDVSLVAQRGVKVKLEASRRFVGKIEASVRLLKEALKDERIVYGVNTGVGDSCGRLVPNDLVEDLPARLSRFHGCGLGRHFDSETTIAILLARLVSLARGYSGVRMKVLERLCEMINCKILPLVPEEGSVGASGDLTPLSYIAGVISGEGEVRLRGEKPVAAALALKKHGLAPIALAPKESLAIMNGTSVMTALACLAYGRAEYLARLSSRLTAMVSLALLGNKAHFAPRLFELKPHPGQAQIAEWIARDIGYSPECTHSKQLRIQDTYAIRCAPHVIGVLADALPWMRAQIETELNSVNDNPIIDPETHDILHGGNFYGGHIAFVMDSMKAVVANIADLMDRQFALLVDEKRNQDLPPNLSGADASFLPINHGFKAVQITCSACAAEALKLTMPASAFSRSTEAHNQDKVSMGTIAARDSMRVIELAEQVFAGTALAAAQAIDLRLRQGILIRRGLSKGVLKTHRVIRQHSDFLKDDRALEKDIRKLIECVKGQTLL